MKLNKKGFTLVELLAVIVVLSIIALIGYTAIGNVIDNSHDSADKLSVGEFAKSISQAVLTNQIDSKRGIAAVTVAAAVDSSTLKDLEGNLIYNGDVVKCTSATYDTAGKVTLGGCKVAGRTKTYKYDPTVGKAEAEATS